MFRVQCEWGPHGVKKLSKKCDVTIIVDVLSFSTSVDIAVDRSIQVIPYGGPLETAPEFAIEHDALLAQHRGKGGFSLSPASFAKMPHVEQGKRWLLPISRQFCQDAACRASCTPIT
jgi:2-phosphosulfolactate phosphatase